MIGKSSVIAMSYDACPYDHDDKIIKSTDLCFIHVQLLSIVYLM